MDGISLKEALHQAASYCAKTERSPLDVETKLSRLGIPPEEAKTIINKLQQEGFLDENRYATYFTKDKIKFQGWGKIKIAYQLQQKGIGKEAIQEAFLLIDPQEYLDKLQLILQAKKRQTSAKDKWELENKLTKFALSRGFEFDLIKKAIQQTGSD